MDLPVAPTAALSNADPPIEFPEAVERAILSFFQVASILILIGTVVLAAILLVRTVDWLRLRLARRREAGLLTAYVAGAAVDEPDDDEELADEVRAGIGARRCPRSQRRDPRLLGSFGATAADVGAFSPPTRRRIWSSGCWPPTTYAAGRPSLGSRRCTSGRDTPRPRSTRTRAPRPAPPCNPSRPTCAGCTHEGALAGARVPPHRRRRLLHGDVDLGHGGVLALVSFGPLWLASMTALALVRQRALFRVPRDDPEPCRRCIRSANRRPIGSRASSAFASASSSVRSRLDTSGWPWCRCCDAWPKTDCCVTTRFRSTVNRVRPATSSVPICSR